VDVGDRLGGKTRGVETVDEPLHVCGGELGQPDSTNMRGEVVSHDLGSANVCRGADLRPVAVFQPTLKESAHGLPLIGER